MQVKVKSDDMQLLKEVNLISFVLDIKRLSRMLSLFG